MGKSERIYETILDFINIYSIDCVEDVYQRDSVNESCVDLVAELVRNILEE